MGKGLLEYETLTGEEIVELLKGHPPVRDTGGIGTATTGVTS
jgi:cell division protease FtsH